jgi:hypothetical protein
MSKIAFVLVAGVAASAASAQQTILTFGFTELNGSYSVGSGIFSAVGVDQGVGSPLRTSGDVSRLQGPTGTAVYSPGTGNNRVNVALAVSGILGTTANGAGTIQVLDINGDILSATVQGQFIANGPAVFFNGLLTNASFTSVSGDNTFDGPSGGSFPLTFAPALPPYTGAIIQLYVGSPGNFFSGNFTGVSTQVSGAIVPGPASLAAMGLGLAAFGGRRRRR